MQATTLRNSHAGWRWSGRRVSMLRKALRWGLMVAGTVALPAPVARAQEEPAKDPVTHTMGTVAETVPAGAMAAGETPVAAPRVKAWELYLSVTTNGAGAGVRRRWGNPQALSFHLLGEIGGAREDTEFPSFDIYGRPVRNRSRFIILVPTTFGIQRRLFAEAIEDNFRPFLLIEGGPLWGIGFPTGHGFGGNIKRKDTSITLMGYAGFGMEVETAENMAIALTLGYRVAHFFEQLINQDDFNAFAFRLGVVWRL